MSAPLARDLALLLVLLLVACGSASGGGPPAGRPGAEAVPAARPPAASAPAAGCAGDANQPAPPSRPARLERVQVAVSAASLSFLPLYVARALGLFEAEGLDAEIVVMRSDLQVAGLLSGEVQYTGVGGDPIAAAVWVRGILQRYYGLDLTRLRWFAPPDLFPRTLPPGIAVEPLPPGADLDALLVAGELDAVIYPDVLPSLQRGHPDVHRLFEDYKTAEQAFYRETRIFPISHLVALKEEVVRAHPTAPLRNLGGAGAHECALWS